MHANAGSISPALLFLPRDLFIGSAPASRGFALMPDHLTPLHLSIRQFRETRRKPCRTEL
jgi:hypothetical protein